MTDDIDNDGTTLHESGGVVQPTDARIEAAVTTAVKQGALSWAGFREDAEGRFTLPVLSRSHYGLVRLGFSLAVPQAPLQAQAVLRKVVHYGNCMATGNIMAAEAAMSAVEDAIASPAPLQAEPVGRVGKSVSGAVGIAYLPGLYSLPHGTELYALATPRAEPVPVVASEPMDAENWAELYRLREAVKGPPGYATWQDAATAERIRRVKAERATPQAEPAVAEQARNYALHAAIMNLPGLPERHDVTYVLGYRNGHRDARHAAAELALASQSTPPPESAQAAMRHNLESAANYIDRLGGDSTAYRQALAANPTAQTDGGSKA